MVLYTYIPLSYNTYNQSYYVASIAASILFFVFYVMLYTMLQFELFNYKNYCDPKFYYGRACRNEISDRILKDPGLLKAKQAFYDSMQKTIDPTTAKDGLTINDASGNIQGNLKANDQFIKDTVQQIQETTNIVNIAATGYLGNLHNLAKSTQNLSSTTWSQIEMLPKLLADLQSKIREAIVTPALARYVDPLQKLYKSLAGIQPNTVPA